MRRYLWIFFWYLVFTGLITGMAVYTLAKIESDAHVQNTNDPIIRQRALHIALERNAEKVGRDYSLHILFASFAITGLGSILEILPGTSRRRRIKLMP